MAAKQTSTASARALAKVLRTAQRLPARPEKITDAEYARATTVGKAVLNQPLHAKSLRYDAAANRLRIVFNNGLDIGIDPGEIALLRDVPRNALREACLSPGGTTITLEKADLDVSVLGLLRNVIPLVLAKSIVAAHSGRVRTHAKSEAARANGKKGGRPKKTALVPA
jgi:hypothetical protein